MMQRFSAAAAALSFTLLTALAVTGCGQGRSASDSVAESGDPAQTAATRRSQADGDSVRSIAVVIVKSGLATGSLYTTFLEPLIDAPVVARHSGIVRAVSVVEGQRVARGAVLARLEDDEQRLEWERADALADQAEAEFERARKLIEREVISPLELEGAEAKARVARAEAGRAKLDFDRCTLRAPMAGVVRLVRAEVYALVEEDEELFRVAATSRLRASLYLPNALRKNLHAGDKIGVVALGSGSAEEVEGRVRIVNPIADPVTGRFHVEIETPRSGDLQPGVDIRVNLGQRSGESGSVLGGAVLPRNAYIERSAGMLAVFRVHEGRVEEVVVELGELGPDGFAVLSGLTPGDLVVSAAQIPPVAGSRVSPQLPGRMEP